MRTRRIAYFVLSILAGILIGLAYGWFANPAQTTTATPDTLRADYQADYVLMVAEVYHDDGDLAAAEHRLALLGDTPLRRVQQAILTAEQLGYLRSDIEQLAELSQAVQFSTPAAPAENAP